MNLEQALELAKSKRQKISPNAGKLILKKGFLKQLKEYELEINK